MKTNLTEEQIKSNIQAYEAWLRNENVHLQYYRFGVWNECDKTGRFGCSPEDIIRIKPQPTYRPWKPEEVPLGAFVKHVHDSGNAIVSVIGCRFQTGVSFHDRNTFIIKSYKELLEDYKWSTDNNSSSWLPCGVLE